MGNGGKVGPPRPLPWFGTLGADGSDGSMDRWLAGPSPGPETCCAAVLFDSLAAGSVSWVCRSEVWWTWPWIVQQSWGTTGKRAIDVIGASHFAPTPRSATATHHPMASALGCPCCPPWLPLAGKTCPIWVASTPSIPCPPDSWAFLGRSHSAHPVPPSAVGAARAEHAHARRSLFAQPAWQIRGLLVSLAHHCHSLILFPQSNHPPTQPLARSHHQPPVIRFPLLSRPPTTSTLPIRFLIWPGIAEPRGRRGGPESALGAHGPCVPFSLVSNSDYARPAQPQNRERASQQKNIRDRNPSQKDPKHRCMFF